jgi:hypothetical protein
MKNLMKEIFNCLNIEKCFNKENTVCNKIIKSQGVEKIDDFFIPEPWNGDLENAKILFVSSNPSIDINEYYPKNNWQSNDKINYFANRFDLNAGYVNKYIYIKLNNGNFSTNWVRYWANIRKRAEELIESVIPGKDYCITEVVHCKSIKEKGVKESLEQCFNNYFEKKMKISSAKLVICLGKSASNKIKEKYKINEDEIGPIDIENKKIIFLPHPNSRGRKKIEDFFDDKTIKILKKLVN